MDEKAFGQLQKNLSTEEISALSSVYIDTGLKLETWQIQEVTIDGSRLDARVNMLSTFVSPTDPGGFHLSIFCAQEILSQLGNIYLHVAAGLKVKSRESWMRQANLSYRNAIRERDNIKVEMDFYRLKWVDDTLLTWFNSTMTDGLGGLFSAHFKAFLR